ncbi:TPA: hypothetical protein ACH3X2_001144 [Trebouxia sp. C0005]
MSAANRMDLRCKTSSLPRQFHRSLSWRTAYGTILHTKHERPSCQRRLQQAIPRLANMFVPNTAHVKRTVQASVQAVTNKPLGHRQKVVGLGLACWDFLAQVATFPKPDEKLRTQRMETRGGGNCANALTAASRLGTDACLVTKVGNDRIGQQIVQELQADGVNTDFLLRSQGASHFSYMIVDKQGKDK